MPDVLYQALTTSSFSQNIGTPEMAQLVLNTLVNHNPELTVGYSATAHPDQFIS
jgi:hypothetical protein